MSAALVIAGSDAAPIDFGEEHKRIVREAFASGATDAEFNVLWAGARSRGLDPVRKQIHFVKRYDNAKNCEVWSSQVSIDGFRAIAQSTGLYDGQDEPEYTFHADGGILSVKIKAYRKDVSRAFVGIAEWSEFVQLKRDNKPIYMWTKMPRHMLAKCAEALALRKAFPEQLAGLYTPDEMGHDVDEVRGKSAAFIDAEPASPRPVALAHVALPGDALFKSATLMQLPELLQAAREDEQGPAAELAFASRIATLAGQLNAESEGVEVQYGQLAAAGRAAMLEASGVPYKTIGRALSAARARLGIQS